VKKIPLTQGQYAIVDDDDFAWLSLRKWCAARAVNGVFYAVRRVWWPGGKRRQRTVYMHVLIARVMGPVADQVDHQDGNTLNNRRSNLRPATQSQNLRNRKKQIKTTSRFKGVYWHKAERKWMARIMVNKKRLFLGQFSDEVQAALAYDEAARKHFGEFAKLNF